MPYLKWISDSNLEKAVAHLLDKAVSAKKNADTSFGKNVIDPFSALFQMVGFEMDYSDWHKSETARQAQKTLQNHVGEFHQNILGNVTGWKNMEVGNVIDIASDEHKTIAEIKNKYNTLSGGQLSNMYSTLESMVMPKTSIYKEFMAYYVAIIPKKAERFNKPFTPSDKEKGDRCPTNKLIREIDGASFYDLVTGCENSLRELYSIIPIVTLKLSKGVSTILESDKKILLRYFEIAFGDTTE